MSTSVHIHGCVYVQVEGDDILYVGDHIYTDAALAKINFRWRTALIIRCVRVMFVGCFVCTRQHTCIWCWSVSLHMHLTCCVVNAAFELGCVSFACSLGSLSGP
jgi:hypothetical protein